MKFSWLNLKEKPEVKIAEIIYDTNSKSMVESKLLKLYLNFFNNSKFSNANEVQAIIAKDLALILKQTAITCKLYDIEANYYLPQQT